MSAKRLCSWDKARIRDKREKLVKIVSQPKYVCERCARVASSAKHLCRPDSLD